MSDVTLHSSPRPWIVRGGTLRTPDGRAVRVSVDSLIVGRGEGADVVLTDPEISACHCELRAVREGVLLRDLGSTNGTLVGALRVREVVITGPADIVIGGTRLALEVDAKRSVEIHGDTSFGRLCATSPEMRRIFGVLAKVAPTTLSVLVTGETGTGKELVARALHEGSPRARGELVVVDCGAIPPSLAESILFGHERGSFTGANERRTGALAQASGGTLFLDEVGELPLELQPKLLRALAERQVRRVGANAFDPIDVRVVAATRRELGVEMNAGRFRSDLYFRLAQVRLELPPLRARRADVPAIVEALCAQAGRPDRAPPIVNWLDENLSGHDWPGNVRELVNVVQVALQLLDTPGGLDDVLSLIREPGPPDDLGSEGRQADGSFSRAKTAAITAFERAYFSALMTRANGNVSEMARQSGLERHRVRAYLRRLGLMNA